MALNPYTEWEEYQNIEEDFLRYLRNVPLAAAHFEVWSFPLSNFLINIGSLIDSFFKNIAFEESMRSALGIETITGEKGKSNIVRYQAVFEPFYSLSKSTIMELKNYSALFPFANWNMEDNRKPTAPSWWDAYTSLKHDRFQNNEQATLKNTLDALGGLFLLNVKSIETRRALLANRVIITSKFPFDSATRMLEKNEPFNCFPGMYYAKTNLFGYVYETEGFALNEEHRKLILSPKYRGFFNPSQDSQR
ncbi:MAG: hypothetical protein ABFC89_04285 [Methanospirillum sp.]